MLTMVARAGIPLFAGLVLTACGGRLPETTKVSPDGHVLEEMPARVELSHRDIVVDLRTVDGQSVEVTAVGGRLIARRVLEWSALRKIAEHFRADGTGYFTVRSRQDASYCFYYPDQHTVIDDAALIMTMGYSEPFPRSPTTEGNPVVILRAAPSGPESLVDQRNRQTATGRRPETLEESLRSPPPDNDSKGSDAARANLPYGEGPDRPDFLEEGYQVAEVLQRADGEISHLMESVGDKATRNHWRATGNRMVCLRLARRMGIRQIK